MIDYSEYRIFRKEYLYTIFLELNDEHKPNDREFPINQFVQILITKHCDFIVNIVKFIQKAMMKRNITVHK